MIGSVVIAIGTVIAMLGATVAVSAAAVSRSELARWVARRLRGAAVASTAYAAPGTVLRIANALSAVGVLLVGAGLAQVLDGLAPLPRAGIVFLAVIPGLVVLVNGISQVLGERWSESVVDRATPWARLASSMLTPLLAPSEPGDAPLVTEAVLELTDDGVPTARARLLNGVLEFTERPVRDVMTPRTDVVGIAQGATLTEVGQLFAESGYSRMPVYADTLDNIVGMMYAFDLLKVTPGSAIPVRPVSVTPGSKECSTLLLEMQRERRQMAVVLDEYGGTDGIVTLEDLLEDLVGEIFDDDEPAAAADGVEHLLVELDGSTPVGELAGRFGVDLPAEAETVGGLLTRLAGRIPGVGERFAWSGLEFDVLAATPTRVGRVVVRRGPARPAVLGVGS